MNPLEIVGPVLDFVGHAIDHTTNVVIPGIQQQAMHHVVGPAVDKVRGLALAPIFGTIHLVGQIIDHVVAHNWQIPKKQQQQQQQAIQQQRLLPLDYDKLCQVAHQTELAARETIALCQSTQSKQQAMVSFANEIVHAFQSLQTSSTSAKADEKEISKMLDTIRVLTDSKQVMAAKTLAVGLQKTAELCVEKSIIMMNALQDGVDCLPEFLQYRIERPTCSDRELTELQESLEKDIQDVRSAVEQANTLNVITGPKVGLLAFQVLAEKAKKTRILFLRAESFASEIAQVKTMFDHNSGPLLDAGNMIRQVKTLLSCIRMSHVMKKTVAAAGQLLALVADLFQVLASRVSKLWQALTGAKDSIKDCLSQVRNTKTMIVHCQSQGLALMDISQVVAKELERLGDTNNKLSRLEGIRRLTVGSDCKIHKALVMAREMDAMLQACASQASDLVNTLGARMGSFPSILTQGMDYDELNGSKEGETEVGLLDVTGDLEELELVKRSVVAKAPAADGFSAAARDCAASFGCVATKTQSCSDFLQQVQLLVSDCELVMEDFLIVWDLEAVPRKLQEVHRLVRLGERTRQHARSVDWLVKSITSLIRASEAKLKMFVDPGFEETGIAVHELIGRLSFN